LNIWDIGILKLYCALFGVIVGAYISTFVKEHAAWFLLAVIIHGVSVGFRRLTGRAQ